MTDQINMIYLKMFEIAFLEWAGVTNQQAEMINLT